MRSARRGVSLIQRPEFNIGDYDVNKISKKTRGTYGTEDDSPPQEASELKHKFAVDVLIVIGAIVAAILIILFMIRAFSSGKETAKTRVGIEKSFLKLKNSRVLRKLNAMKR